MITEDPRTGEFLLAEANGTLSREEVVIASGRSLVAGTVLGKLTSGGKYVAYNNALVDGSQTAVGILYESVDATSADAVGVMLARHAEVRSASLTGIDAAGIVELATLDIIVR